MKVNENGDYFKCNPVDMSPENVDEMHLLDLLKVLVAARKITREEIMAAWKLTEV